MTKGNKKLFVLDICVQSVLIAFNTWWWILLFFSNTFRNNTDIIFPFALLLATTLYQSIWSTYLQNMFTSNTKAMKYLSKHTSLVWLVLFIMVAIVMVGTFITLPLSHIKAWNSMARILVGILIVGMIIFYELAIYYFYIISLWHYKTLG